ncbi:hypothetical protein [Methanochimaera problematica]|nr:hypothetical protein [Methanoplanus sp. FWC-SCC4]
MIIIIIVCNTSGCIQATDAGLKDADACTFEKADFVLENETFVGDDEEMADFIETNNTKTATRKLENPIPDIETFDSIVQDVVVNNPFGCVGYVSNGMNIAGVSTSKQGYTAKFIFEDDEAKSVGSMSVKAPAVHAYNAAITAVLADTALADAVGGDCVRDREHDTYSHTLKCMDPNGEIYYVSINRTNVRLSSYTDDAIRDKVETWADGVAALF